MGFDSFIGNAPALASLRRMLAGGRLPHSLILAGPSGVGKHTLASMVARALNCLDDEALAAGDFCGLCANCRRIAPTEAPAADEEFAKLLAARAKMRAEDRRDRPLMFSSHPDVIAFLPDGPLRQISIDQTRTLKELAQFLPASGRRRVMIVDEADRMDAPAANSMLKVLEEPPETTVLILTATNYYELLSTIRSRCIVVHLSPAAEDEVEHFLESRSGMSAADRRLAAHLAEGCPGRALGLDLEAARKQRRDASEWLGSLASARPGVRQGVKPNYEEIMVRTENLARGEDNLETVVAVLYSLIEDLLHLQAGRPPLRNVELESTLRPLAARVTWKWLECAATRLDALQRNLRRNVNRQLALEALASILSA
jgi:DNA polymerase-3 subunit delta'